MTQEPVPPLPPKSNSTAKGCIIGCAIVAIVGIVGTVLIGYAMYSAGMGALDSFTEDQPRPVPEVQMTEAESTATQAKVEQFMNAVKSGESEDKEFRFTGQEINVLLRSDPEFSALGESVYVTIEQGEVSGQVSLDLGQFVPFLAGRYANGTATFSVSAENDRLFVFVEDFTVKGEPAAPEVIEQVRSANLAEEAMSNPEFTAVMKNVESVEVEGDHLVVTLK